MKAEAPNILLIVIDQLRADALGCLGSSHAVTPHIDALASRGVTFARHYVQGSPCGPSRASLATGQYVMNHRVINNDAPTSQHLKTLPMFARELGYEPALIGYTTTVPDPRHTHFNDPRLTTNSIAGGWNIVRNFEEPRDHYLAWLSGMGYEVDAGFEALFRPDGRPHDPTWLPPSPIAAEHTDTAWCTEGALDYLRIRRRQPWFLHLGYFRPHPPFMPSAPFHNRVHPSQMTPPVRAESVKAEGDVHPLTALLLQNVKAKSAMGWMPGLACELSLDEVARMRAAYLGLLAEVDHQLGRVIDLLQKTSQLDRTLVVLTSDHGEQLGDHHLVAKRGYFPQSYHVPCIVVDPRPQADFTRGHVVEHFTENVDILPTIMDWMGQDIPRQCDGRSLMPFIEGRPPLVWREEAHWEFDFRDLVNHEAAERLGIPRDECSLSVICSHEYAYVHFAALQPLLFDLKNDPHWLSNVADDSAYRDVALMMARKMLNWRLSHADRTTTGWAIGKGGLRHWNA